MTSKTTITKTIEPLSPGESDAWFVPLCEAAVVGAFEPPENVVLWAHALNLAEQADHEAVSGNRRDFPTGWEGASVVRTAQTLQAGALAAELTSETIEAAVVELAKVREAARLSVLRRELLSETFRRLHDIAVVVFREPSILPSLQAAHAEILAAVRELGADVPTTDAQALDSPIEMVGKYRRLRILNDRWQALRAAWDAVRANPLERHGTRDVHGWFSDSPAGPDFAGTLTTTANIRRHGPDGLERLVWLAGEGRGWLPSIAEQSAAVDQWAAEAAQRAKDSGKAPVG
jgi:hypothetical protein